MTMTQTQAQTERTAGPWDLDFIVTACNAHDELVAALTLAEIAVGAGSTQIEREAAKTAIRTALAKLDAQTTESGRAA